MDPGDQSPGPDLTGVVDSVMQLFGEVMSRDAVFAIVEHCGGDLTQAIDIVVNMTEDSSVSAQNSTSATPTVAVPVETTNNVATGSRSVAQNQQNITSTQISPPRISYAGTSQAKGAFPKKPPIQNPMNVQNSIWTLQTKQIVGYHNQASRILILMRGLPGSGKSFLAKALVDAMCPGMNYRTFIFSTDDFFQYRGQYVYNKNMLPEAHAWNINRVQEAIGRGVSPIFVDNTNIEIFHMEPYVRAGVQGGYIIEVLEPNTPWAKKVGQLARKNIHDVPIYSLKRLMGNFQEGVRGVYLIRSFGISYPADKKPPVRRNYPPILEFDMQQYHQNVVTPVQALQTHRSQVLPPKTSVRPSSVIKTVTSDSEPTLQDLSLESVTDSASNHVDVPSSQADVTSIEIPQSSSIQTNVSTQQSSIEPITDTPIKNELQPCALPSDNTDATTGDIEIQPHDGNDPLNKLSFVILEDMRKQLDHIEKLEEEWENGDAWNDDTKKQHTLIENPSAFIPKPPRNSSVNSTDSDRFLPPDSNYSDWSKISMFMPSWKDGQPTSLFDTPNIKVETTTTGTGVDFGDTDVNTKNFKVLIGTPRDINFYYMGFNVEKIPNKRMLDKSSMTNDHDHIAVETVRCKNEEKHFVAFRKLFKHISKVELRDIFDKCVGDVNWAVDIVFDGMANHQLHTVGSGDISDTEDFGDEQCDCLAVYNVIPDMNTQPKAIAAHIDSSLTEAAGASAPLPGTPKLKKDKNLSESSIQLKRQIEKNVVISDSHYSDHCLKIRKMRRGKVNDGQVDPVKEETEEICVASTSTATEPAVEPYLSTDDDDSQIASSDDGERFVNVDLGTVFVSELDHIFSRDDMTYPENILTRINMPVSMLNEINALWIESFMNQLDQQSRQSEIMLRQDEEFARQLALKEEQLAQAGEEPAVPDLKDIMDMELALSIYKKEITAEWRSNEPNDLAAKMTREKLYNLFPDVSQETLSELLMAHDNNFQATVEVLLSSTGNAHILEEENGVAKFITTKELERHEKLIEEQKKALSEVEWPLLPTDIKINMDTVQEYRAKASQHMIQRNKNRLRAESYLNKNMLQIASYYSDVAALHKKKFDEANSLAAASLMQVHAANCTDNATLDLHFLRVAEAVELLDLFLDTHIRKLRELQARGGPRFHTLFFITGRGIHSHGGPRVKPATKRRLRERGIAYGERNPGLLSSRVGVDDKLTHEIP